MKEIKQLRSENEEPRRSHSKNEEDIKTKVNDNITTHVEVWKEEIGDKEDFNQITEQQKGESNEAEEGINVLQTNERLVREVAERKRYKRNNICSQRENIPEDKEGERKEINFVKNIMNRVNKEEEISLKRKLRKSLAKVDMRMKRLDR